MSPAFLPVGWSSEITARRPRAVTLAGVPLVAWRDASGALRVLADRCPHRAYPLSQGRVVSGDLQCGYHGWRFGGDGACRAIPALTSGDPGAPARCATSHAAVDAGGVAWACAEAGVTPREAPRVVETSAGESALSLRWSFDLPASLADAAENILDVPHTAFLHGGLFRKPGRGLEIEARVRRRADRIEAEYVGEPVPSGLLGRVLAPQGGVVTHVDRFVMPCIAQVEYALGPRLRVLATTFLSPESAARTRALHVVSLAPRALGFAALPVFAPLAWFVLRQDARALAHQSRNLARFPGARFTSTDLDVLGPHLRQMIERSERGEAALPDADWTARLAP